MARWRGNRVCSHSLPQCVGGVRDYIVVGLLALIHILCIDKRTETVHLRHRSYRPYALCCPLLSNWNILALRGCVCSDTVSRTPVGHMVIPSAPLMPQRGKVVQGSDDLHAPRSNRFGRFTAADSVLKCFILTNRAEKSPKKINPTTSKLSWKVHRPRTPCPLALRGW